jgi:hypothetical protein
MKHRIKHIALLFVLLMGVLSNVFAIGLVHDGSKISIEKSAVGAESIKAWEGLINIPTLRKNIDWLTRSSKWIDEGAEFVTTNGVTKLRKGADDILEIKNEKILPNKHSSTGTPVGDPSNGYQVVKNGNELSVKRVPETGNYSQTDIAFLTKNPSSHTLLRHGHDVTDDALIKRATEGISPEGVPNTFPSGGVATKFSSEQAVKDAIDNVKPGTQAFAAKVQQPNGLWVAEAPGNYGYGFSANGSGGPQQMLKVTAVYKEMPNGFFELITMYPNR